MKQNQMTILEANERSIGGGNVNIEDIIYMSPADWGNAFTGTLDEWKAEIPESEHDAKNTSYHDWYRQEDPGSWAEYRSELLEQLIKVVIVEDSEN